MKELFNRFKAYVLDRKIEKKESKMAAKRAALEAAQSYVVPVLTVATMTSVALAGNFNF